MKIKKLSNGLTIIYNKQDTKTVAIQITVKVGSNYETLPISGISHFIEHMVFEGTKNYPDSRSLSNVVESLGGELNAYTSDERTTYHIKIVKKHFNKALQVLSDILTRPLFRAPDIEKERKIITDEIKLVIDEPRNYQWVLFEKTLFKKHPVRNPTYGSVKAVNSMTRKQLLDYYNTYYTAPNTLITVVGNIDNVFNKIKTYFSHYSPKKAPKLSIPNEPKQRSIQKKFEPRKLNNSYVILGYKTAIRKNKDSYALDLIRGIMARGQSGKLFYEIRTKRGLCYEIGMHHEPSKDYGFIAVYLGTDKKNISKSIKVILAILKNLQSTTQKELDEAKEYIEGSFYLENEDNYQLADNIGSWALLDTPEKINSYIKNIRKVSLSQLKSVAKRYFTKNYTLAALKQK